MRIFQRVIIYKILEYCIDTLFDGFVSKFKNKALIKGTVLSVYDIYPGLILSKIEADGFIFTKCLILNVDNSIKSTISNINNITCGFLYFSYNTSNTHIYAFESDDNRAKFPIDFAIHGNWKFIV